MNARFLTYREDKGVRIASASGVALLLVGIALLDRETGLFHLTMVYVAPIIVATYVFGLAGGLVTAVVALAEVAATHSLQHSATLTADVTTDFVVFLFVAVVIDRLRSQLRTIRRLETRRDFDLGVARDVQRRMLSPSPTDSRFDFACALDFASEVGGDYYRFDESSGQLFLFTGDISGKGVSAALFAMLLDETIGAALAAEDTLASVVGSVNRRMYASMPPEMFVTMFFAVLGNETMAHVNAGHVRPLLYQAATKRAIELSSAATLPLGVDPTIVVTPDERRLASGDTLLIFSDGVTESPALLHDPGLLPSVFEQTAEEGPRAVVDRVTALAESQGQTDDVTVVCVRRR